MKPRMIAAAAAAMLLSAAPAWAQSITPLSDWVPHIDRAAAATRDHAKTGANTNLSGHAPAAGAIER